MINYIATAAAEASRREKKGSAGVRRRNFAKSVSFIESNNREVKTYDGDIVAFFGNQREIKVGPILQCLAGDIIKIRNFCGSLISQQRDANDGF